MDFLYTENWTLKAAKTIFFEHQAGWSLLDKPASEGLSFHPFHPHQTEDVGAM